MTEDTSLHLQTYLTEKVVSTVSYHCCNFSYCGMKREKEVEHKHNQHLRKIDNKFVIFE